MQKLIAGNFELDLEKSVSIPLVFKISDIRDISKRSGSFSKTIVLPGTEINNRFFDGIYDFNNDFTNFNPNVKTPCVFSLDGDEHINGYLQLKTVVRDDKGEINYNVVLYDNVLTFWTNLDKKKLGDLDFSALDHIYTKDNIVTSWGHAWTDGYFYPMLYNSQSIIKTTDFKPAIYLKYLLDKIITDAGFTWSGNLKSNPIFEKEVLLNSIDRPTISPTVAASKTFRVSKSAPELIATELVPNAPIFIVPLPVDFDDETTPPNQDANNLWSVNKFTAPLVGNYRINLQNIRTRITYNYTVSPNNFFTPNGYGNAGMDLIVEIRDNLSNLVDSQIIPFTFVNQVLTRLSTSRVFDSFFINQPLYVNNLLDIYLGAGWTIELFIRPTGTSQIQNAFGTAPQPEYTITSIEFYEVEGGIESLFVQYAYDDNVPLIFEDFINTEFDQKEIIKDIIARYNCFVYVNPEDSGDIVFNIRDEFYATAPILDYTDKKDFNTRDQIKLIGELQSEEMLLSYTKGDDSTNKSYTDAVGDSNIYGQFKYNFANEFVKGEKKITSPYNPTPLIQHGHYGTIIVPAVNSRAPITGMRVLLVAGLIEVGNVAWTFSYRNAAGNIVQDTINGYPYAGHYDDPNAPTIDINFGTLPFPQLYYPLTQTTSNNLFNRYWANTINQIADGRLVISKFNLTASDVYFIKNNPNTRLFVDNKYYYINKITFEGNEALKTLTTIELLTVEDELQIDFVITPILKTGDSLSDLPLGTGGGTGVGIGVDIGNGVENNPIPNSNPYPLNTTAQGVNNTIGANPNRVTITGDNNFVDNDATDVLIQGNNNRVFGNNVTLIGVDNLTVRGDNVSVINGIITKDCKSSIFFNKIDGGYNALRNPGSKSEINKICGEKDGEFNLFVVSLFNKIDSDNGITEEI